MSSESELSASQQQMSSMSDDPRHRSALELISTVFERTRELIQSHRGRKPKSKQQQQQQPQPSQQESRGGNRSARTKRGHGDDDDEEIGEEEEEEELYTRLNRQPSLIVNCVMRDYQLEGLNWMIRLYESGVSGILADEMGLGKTLQTISMLAYLKEYRKINGPHIILCPLSTLGNWCNEFERFCPTLRICRFHGDAQARTELVEEVILPRKFDVLVTTFEMASREKAALKRIDWQFFVVDEAHRLKNENSLLSRDAREFKSRNRLLVTGTPLQNNLHELWALLNFLLPTIFPSSDEFDAMFSNVEEANTRSMAAATGEATTTDTGSNSASTELLTKLHALLRPFMLRRLKSDVTTNLPPKKETLVYVGMVPLQRKVYKGILLGNLESFEGKERNRTQLLNVMMQLRKAANHPYLLEGVEDLSQDPLGEHLVQNSGKMIVLDKLLRRLKEQGSRCLIFSQMTRQLDILEDFCHMRGYQYCRIDGSTTPEERDAGMQEFNRPGSEKFIFLLSTRAGGLGINLATADVVILFDSDWNPQADLQAQDRAHRIGQKKPVSVYRFVTEDSVEEKIVMRAETKLRLDAMVIQQGRLAQGHKRLSAEDIAGAIRCGAENIFKATDVANVMDEDIELILQKGEAKTQELNAKLQKFTGFNLSLTGRNIADMTEAELDELERSVDDPMDVAKRKELDELLRLEKLIQMREQLGKRQRKPVEGWELDQFDMPLIIVKKPRRIPVNTKSFQLFNEERIRELADIEMKFYLKYCNSTNPPRECGLTEEEEEELDTLLKEGFPKWKFTQYRSFLRACERFGRHNYEQIAREVPGKTLEEVKEYAQAFWQRYHLIKDIGPKIKAIEQAEAKLEQSRALLDFCVRRYPLTEYPTATSARMLPAPKMRSSLRERGFDAEDDAVLMWNMAKQNVWGQWGLLQDLAHEEPTFRFNYAIRSRTSLDLARRADVVVRHSIKAALDERKRSSAAAAASGANPDAPSNELGFDAAALSVVTQKRRRRKTTEAAGAQESKQSAEGASGADPEASSNSNPKSATDDVTAAEPSGSPTVTEDLGLGAKGRRRSSPEPEKAAKKVART